LEKSLARRVTLSATSWPVLNCSARHTSPMPPRPNGAMVRYPSTRGGGEGDDDEASALPAAALLAFGKRLVSLSEDSGIVRASQRP
jgi:hypothetical protein